MTTHKPFRFKVKPSTHPELFWLSNLTPEQANRKSSFELFSFLPDEIKAIVWDYYSVNRQVFENYAAIISMELQHRELERLVSHREIKLLKENMNSITKTTPKTKNNWRMAFTKPSLYMQQIKQKFTKHQNVIKKLERIYSDCLTHAKEGLSGEKDWFWEWSQKGLFRDEFRTELVGRCSVCQYPPQKQSPTLYGDVTSIAYPHDYFSHEECAKIHCKSCLGVCPGILRGKDWCTTNDPDIVSTLVWKSFNPIWKTGSHNLMCSDNTMVFDKYDIKKWLQLYNTTWESLSNLLNS